MSKSPAAYIDAHSGDLVARLQQLVGISTVNPPGINYASITSYLVHELQAVGLKARRLPIPAAKAKKILPRDQHDYPRYNVLGQLAVRGAKKTIHFNAHYDVVPVSGSWRHGSPFSGAVSGGWIYGRGTADMKGSIASLLLALQALKATKTASKLNVEVSFTADEETDSLLGAGWLVENAPIKPDYAIVMEGGEGDQICCGHNGVVWLEVTVHGRAAHGSTPEEGINALEKMSALILALDEYKAKLAKQTFTTPDGTVMRPTMNLGGVFSSGEGGKINTVPALARFSPHGLDFPRPRPRRARAEVSIVSPAPASRFRRGSDLLRFVLFFSCTWRVLEVSAQDFTPAAPRGTQRGERKNKKNKKILSVASPPPLSPPLPVRRRPSSSSSSPPSPPPSPSARCSPPPPTACSARPR
jgi:succinyl-diaminopimelate desuccinylase